MLVPIQEFKAHLARYIAHAQSGEVIELTSHRKIVARIVGVSQHGSEGMDRLVAAGVVTWGGGKPKGTALVLPGNTKLMSDIVIEDRG